MTSIWLNVEDEEGVQETSQVSSSVHSANDAMNNKKENITLNSLSLTNWYKAHLINLQQIKTDLNPFLPPEMMVKTKGAADVGKKNSLYRGITNKNPKDPILNAQEEELAKPTKKE